MRMILQQVHSKEEVIETTMANKKYYLDHIVTISRMSRQEANMRLEKTRKWCEETFSKSPMQRLEEELEVFSDYKLVLWDSTDFEDSQELKEANELSQEIYFNMSRVYSLRKQNKYGEIIALLYQMTMEYGCQFPIDIMGPVFSDCVVIDPNEKGG